jgi:Core histone H2A/H2B/H3/H4
MDPTCSPNPNPDFKLQESRPSVLRTSSQAQVEGISYLKQDRGKGSRCHFCTLPFDQILTTDPVFMAAVMEYVVGELFETAGNRTKFRKRKRITNRDILLGIEDDSE